MTPYILLLIWHWQGRTFYSITRFFYNYSSWLGILQPPRYQPRYFIWHRNQGKNTKIRLRVTWLRCKNIKWPIFCSDRPYPPSRCPYTSHTVRSISLTLYWLFLFANAATVKKKAGNKEHLQLPSFVLERVRVVFWQHIKDREDTCCPLRNLLPTSSCRSTPYFACLGRFNLRHTPPPQKLTKFCRHKKLAFVVTNSLRWCSWLPFRKQMPSLPCLTAR